MIIEGKGGGEEERGGGGRKGEEEKRRWETEGKKQRGRGSAVRNKTALRIHYSTADDNCDHGGYSDNESVKEVVGGENKHESEHHDHCVPQELVVLEEVLVSNKDDDHRDQETICVQG